MVNCSEIGKYTRIVTPTITRELRRTHSHNPHPRSYEPYPMKVPFSSPYPIPSHIPISFPLMVIIIPVNHCLAVVIVELHLIQTNMFNLHMVVIRYIHVSDNGDIFIPTISEIISIYSSLSILLITIEFFRAFFNHSDDSRVTVCDQIIPMSRMTGYLHHTNSLRESFEFNTRLQSYACQ